MALMENIPINIYIKNDQDQTIYVNSQFEKTMGLKASAVVGKTTPEIMQSDPLQAAELVETDKKVLQDEATIITDEWLLMDSSEPRVIKDYKFPIILPSGEKMVGGAALDITELKEKEKNLQDALDEISELKSRLEKENIELREELQHITKTHDIIGESKHLRTCLKEAEHVAQEKTTVLVLGETGTGKELLAHAIHAMSPRKDRVMVKVNCAALPPNLIESELFGREKGAYTGAMTRQRGRFEQADGSTIFLDEIGDLPLELQSKLLRVLQEGSFEMLGSTKPITVDVRIIAATNRDLRALVKAGQFRKDLFYRINVFPITVPPLSDRRDDIPLLAYAFVEEFNRSMGKSIKTISDDDLEILKTTEWPGNVRELRNIIERSMILSTGSTLHLRKSQNKNQPDSSTAALEGLTLAEVERDHILKALERAGWRVSGKGGAAEVLGLKPTTLEARMKKLAIHRPA